MEYTQNFPCSVSKSYSAAESRAGDYRVEIVDDDTGSLIAPLYFLDSGAGHKICSYEWILPEQIAWLKSNQLSALPPQSLLFMHIAPVEIKLLEPEFYPGESTEEINCVRIGDANEKSEPSKTNSGIYEVMRQMKVTAAFFGHDQ